MPKPFLRASAFMGSLERNITEKMPRAKARSPAFDVGHEQRAEPLAAPVVCDRKREFAFDPIGRKRVARLANHDRCAIDQGLSEQRQLVFSVEMDAVEFHWGQLVQRTETPMVAGGGREPADIGLQDASIARADRPQRHAFSNRQMQHTNETGLSSRHSTHAACRSGRRAITIPGRTTSRAESPSAVTSDRPGRSSTKDSPRPIILSSRSPCWVIQRLPRRHLTSNPAPSTIRSDSRSLR